MKNKKTLLQRLLVIYITFFIVLAASITHGVLPNFTKGVTTGMEMGQNISEKWHSGVPRMIYMLTDIHAVKKSDTPTEITTTNGTTIKTEVRSMDLLVEQDAPGISVIGLAFRSIGGSPWIYALVMLCPLLFLAIIVLMFVIINSLRRSIREECALEKRNVWCLRAIGLLTIGTELISSTVNWAMSCRAAELLSQSGYMVDTSYDLSYSTIIMGILILFAAEVFAIGQNLSEEQKLTI